MEMERQRQAHSKEIESKDEEVDEIRRSCSKKVGTLSHMKFLCFSDSPAESMCSCVEHIH